VNARKFGVEGRRDAGQAAIAAWNRFWFEPGSAATLGVCRMLFFGGLALWLIPHDFAAWGSYSPVFWMPIWLFDTLGVPQLSSPTIAAIQAVWKTALVLSAIGLFTRPAMLVSFGLGAYLMGLPQNFGQTQHFDTLVVFACGALALSRAGDAWSIDALIAGARRRSAEPLAPNGEYTWPIRFVWVATALIFCAAGLSKLRHSGLEWILSDNMAYLLRRQQYHLSDGEPLTRWGLFVARYPVLSQGIAAAAVSVETLFPLVLFSRRARLVLVPLGLVFLIGIRMLMGPTFEQFMLCYVFWIPWERLLAWLRDRQPLPSHLVLYDGARGLCSRSVVTLASADVLRRLRFADVDRDWSWLSKEYPQLVRDSCGSEMHAITAKGRVFAGFDAYRSVATALPLGWVLLPVLYLPGVAPIARRVQRAVVSRRSTRVTSVLPLAR
jgi:predicted DCC family thiol-disulfide oxidoreductase YuxK